MEQQPIRSSKTITIVFAALTTALLAAGFGCADKAEQATDAALTPLTVPLAALEQAKTVTADEQARLNREAAAIANEMTAALIVTEGASVPDGVTAGETIGCNDRVALSEVPRVAATDDVLHDAIASLLDLKDPNVGGLYNALSQSTLAIEKIQSRDGVTTEVWLKGELRSGGTCDDPRIKAQLEHTIKRLRPKYSIILNGSEADYRCFGDQSGQCKKRNRRQRVGK